METVRNLAELVAPLTVAEFLALLRRRELLFWRNPGGNRFAGLLDWTTLRKLLSKPDFPLDSLRVQRESVVVQRIFYSDNKRIDLGRLDTQMRGNTSLVVVPVETHIPALAALCDDIRSHIPEKIQVGVIVTVGAGGAFQQHYDDEDLIILQLEGSKRWQIHHATAANPTKGMPKAPPPEGAPIFDEVLQPGDFLFLPAGSWHHCENGPERSLHLGIFFEPLVAWRPIYDMVLGMLSEELFRQPVTRLADPSELDTVEAHVKRRLLEKIDALSFGDAIIAGVRKPKA
ncbi:MAG: cupin domain-containing protein [Rhizomicrobium sp.]